MSIEAWNVAVKGVSALAAVGTVLYGVVKYLDQRDLEIRQQKQKIEQQGLQIDALVRSSKERFLRKQFDLYAEAVAVVSRLATEDSYAKREGDLDRFWQLYWGELGMVEDVLVESAMVGVKNALSQDSEALKRASLNLSRCVSKSIEESWGVDLNTKPCQTSP